MSKRPHSSPIIDENTDVAAALLSADVEYDSEETMKYAARKKIKTTADGSLNVEYMQDQAFITNSRASPFANAWAKQEETNARLRSLKYELDVVKTEQSNLRREHESLRRDHDGLKERFDCLEGSSTEEEIRHRFISCIKRDVLHAPSSQDYYHINKGNGYAHDGNCLRDANLYGCSGGRTDFGAYEKIYGLSPATLRVEIDPTGDAIPLLNQHATLFANKDHPPTQNFHNAFDAFIKAFKDENYPAKYLNENGIVARRHHEFWTTF